MGFRAVGTNDRKYVGIGGQNTLTGKSEDPTKQYVNIFIEGGASTSITASVDVDYLMGALQAEGFIESFTLPVVEIPLDKTERVAKALLEAEEHSEYTNKEFRQDLYYATYMTLAENLLKGDD